MAKLNKKTYNPIRTHEGAPAQRTSRENELIRSVLACLLWENSFYEDGKSIADRIYELTQSNKIDPQFVSALASAARSDYKLRHVPLWLANGLVARQDGRKYVADTVADIVQRPDELTEVLAMYWANGRKPLANSLKKGLARAFTKFDEYQLAKYNRDADIKLRDVLFLTHPKPQNKQQQEIWNRLVSGNLKTPDTWETNLSAGKDKKETFTRMLAERKMGALAVLRNLRNMEQAGVSRDLIREGIRNMKIDRVLPFRFVSAAKHAPAYEDVLEEAMFKCCANLEKLLGHTVVLVDISGSMYWDNVSQKSELKRSDAAAALAVLVREIADDCSVYTFDNSCRKVAPRRGFALIDAIHKSGGGGTQLGAAVRKVCQSEKFDRLIVITDEQSHDRVQTNLPNGARGYMVNVASYKNGVGYGGSWTNITGFSENLIRYIQELETINF